MAGCVSAFTMDPFTPAVGFLGSPEENMALANSLVGNATLAANQLVTIAGTLVPPTITPEFDETSAAPALEVPEVPEFATVIWEAPNIPAAFTGTVDISGLMPEAFDEDAPTLSFATAPAVFSEAAPDSPAIITSFDDPVLSVSLPAAPDLLSIEVTPFSGITMPTFDAEEPVLTAVAPSIREYTPGAQYTSSLLTALQTSLLAIVEGGGDGIDQDVENAIWDRGREREARSQRDAIDKLDQMEGLGYAFPPGAYLDARVRIITETDYAERGHSREVMIKSAELRLDSVKHALTTAASLEGTLVGYANQVEQRIFESCKYATEAGVAIYNAQVQAFGELTRIYGVKVQVYEAEIRAQLALVETYKTQIEAERLKADVNNALIQQYKVKSEIALSAIEIYKAEIAGIQTKAEIEKTKVMIFGEQVRAYATKVNAYTAGVEGFRASLEAEKTKQQVYQSAVEAYRARVEAGARQIDARISVYEGEIKAKGIEWDGYKATISGESARIQGLVSGNQALADIYKAQVTGYGSLNDTLTKQWQVVSDTNGRRAEVAISAAKANAELYVNSRSLVSDAAKVSATVQAQLGAAALNAVNWSNSLSQSFGQSNSFGLNASMSSGCSTSYNYSGSI